MAVERQASTGLSLVNKQWGYQTVHGTNPVTYDLPIPFEEAPFTVAISTGNSGNHASCGGFTKTTIVLRAGTTAGVWDTVGFFIIGCQLQWGINTGGAVRTSTLPIPFTNVFLAVASTSSEWCCPGCSATNTTVTTRAYQSNRPDVAQPNDVNWIIIGCQPQWGYAGGSRGTFPIAFGQFFSMASVLNNAIEAWERACYNITNTSFQINYGGPILYLAIGKA